MPRSELAVLHDEIIACRACPRLVAWRERVAREKRAMFRDRDYWGKPVPGFGDPSARFLILGLAPAAHGANRTGRIFTGDRSGDFLFAALHRAGFASQPHSVARDDGLTLRGVFILPTLRCAPPANMPTPDEIARCTPFFDREIAILSSPVAPSSEPSRRALRVVSPAADARPRVVLALGAIAWDAYLAHLVRRGTMLPRPRVKFAHGAELPVPNSHTVLLGSYHVSQQNTQTGKLTPAMFDSVLRRAGALLSEETP
jgi:uracil-DNA glycosylase